MANQQTRNAYLDTQIKTASKDQLLMMLFDGAVRFASLARAGIERRDTEAISTNCVKVQNIMIELMSSLDRELISPDLFTNLQSLYNFVYKRMIIANLERSVKAVDDSIVILNQLREVWTQAIQQALAENGGKLPDAISGPNPLGPAAIKAAGIPPLKTQVPPSEAHSAKLQPPPAQPAAAAGGFKRPKINLAKKGA